MKIKTILKEQYRRLLKEADEVALDDINPGADSVSEIADAIKTDINVSDQTAKNTAQEVKEISKEIGADQVSVDPTLAAKTGKTKRKVLFIQNELTDALDAALEDAQEKLWLNEAPESNVLVIGLPGSGKTSSIVAWAKKRGVNLLYVNVKNEDLEAGLYGYTSRDMTDPTVNSVVKLRSSYLDPLDRENSVLFLDEYNRGSRGNRAALLDLISAHRIEGEDLPEVKEARAQKGLPVNDGYRHFDNLLFTVAAMNPEDDFSGIDSTADSLSSAEKSRFSLTIKDFDSRKGPTLDYIRGYIEDTICAMDESRPDFWPRAIAFYKKGKLAEYILEDPSFEFDTKADNATLVKESAEQLNSRTFKIGFFGTYAATPERAKEWVKTRSNFSTAKVKMLVEIIDKYIRDRLEPSEAACRKAINEIRHGETLAKVVDEIEERPEDEDIPEDDDEFGAEDDKTISVHGARELGRLAGGTSTTRDIASDIKNLTSDTDWLN